MSDQRILATELLIGANHPTLADTLNRHALVQHNNDGTHATVTGATINLTSNTLTGTLAQFNTAVSDGNLLPETDAHMLGTPTAPTAALGTNTTQVATMEALQALAFDSTGITPASQSEAEAGTNNTKWVSPLRVAQEIAANVPFGNLMLLSTINASGAATVDIETGFSSTYDDYVIACDNTTCSTGNPNLVCTMKIGGSYIGAGYDSVLVRPDSTGTIYAQANASNASAAIVSIVQSATNETTPFRLNVFNANGSGFKICNFTGAAYYTVSTALFVLSGACSCRTPGVLTGIRLATATGATLTGTFKFYGVRK